MVKRDGLFMPVWLFLLSWMLFPGSLIAQKKIPSDFCIRPAEKRLADSINRIRIAHGKKAIPLSVSLSYVAKVHVTDLIQNHPDTGICNLSSWSDKGKGRWKAVCFNPYVVSQEGMWKKPQELTSYRYRGYELAGYMQDSMRVDTILGLWEDSPEAMAMILTTGRWEKKSWAAMGVALNGHYASVWFGQRPDKAGEPKLCREKQKHTTKKAKVHSYYLIYGSYPGISSAKKVLSRLKLKGYKKTGILRNHKHIRVYLYESSNFQQVKKERQKLSKKYPKLWILQD